MKEIWKDVVILDGRVERDYYKGHYIVSNLGRVKSIKYGRENNENIITSSKNNKGYLMVGLTIRTTKTFLIHRLVAMAFLEDSYFDGAIIDHIDTNRINNNIDNLHWVTQKGNVNNPLTIEKMKNKLISDTHKKILSECNSKKIICTTTESIFDSIDDASRFYEIKRSSISNCLLGMAKIGGKFEGVGLHWEYYDSCNFNIYFD